MPESKTVKLSPAFGKSRQITITKRDLFITKDVQDNIEKAIPKMRYITPNELSSKFGIKISSAKQLLLDLEKKHAIKRYEQVKNPKLWVFVPVAKEGKK